MTKLITDEQRAQLLAIGRQSLENDDFDPPPVVKLFTPDAGATWLLTEIDPDDHDHAFGLCDLGLGAPEIGWVSLGELATVRVAKPFPPLPLAPDEPVRWRNLADPARSADPATFRPASAWAIAGTANPARFFALLRGLGVDARTRAFPDHHRYAPGDLALPDAKAVLMTAKDAVKCSNLADARFWALDIRARIDPSLVDSIEEKLTWTPNCSRSSSAR